MNTDENKILIGVATDGKGGVDSYILSFVKCAAKYNISCDVLTTKFSENYEKKLNEFDARLIKIDNLHNQKNISPTIKNLCNTNNYKAAYWNISTAIMFPYVKAAADCSIVNNVVHAHAHYNSQPNKLKTFIYDAAHYFYRLQMQQLKVKYAACAIECARWIAGNKIVEDKNWTFIPNPIDTNACTYNEKMRATIRERLNLQDKFIIGCATAFMPYKNPLFLIELFSQIQKRDKDTYLLLAGDGPMKKEVVQLSEALLPPDSYRLLGHIKDVPDLLQALDCFVLPSKNEGLPLCILEAQAAGLPCVMSTNITKESIVIPDLVKRISFDKDIDFWVSEILNSKKVLHKRSSLDSKTVSEAGFNLNSPEAALPLLGF